MEEEVVNSTLRRVVKGAGIFLVGTFCTLLFGFFTKVLIARYLTKYDYGVLSLALTILGITQTVLTLGIPSAMVRQASYYLGKKDWSGVKKTVSISAFALLVSGICGFVFIYLSSYYFSIIFKAEELEYALKLLSLSIPFLMLNSYFVSICQIFEQVRLKVLVADIARSILTLSLVVLAVVEKLPFYFLVSVYSIAPAVTFLIFVTQRSKFRAVGLGLRGTGKYAKELISFAVPLFLQGVLGVIVTWTDVLMLGYMLTPVDVGMYSAARTLALLLQQILGAVAFLYFPLVTQLYGQKKLVEIGRTYAVITKWIMSISLPVFLVMFLFPRAVLWVVYSNKYIGAYVVLELLALGFFVHVAFGPNGLTLVSFGDVKFVTAVSAITALANFVMNLLLIPVFGINGAAIATAITYISSNIIVSVKLFTKYGIHPFSRNYIKPLLASLFLAVIISRLCKSVNWLGLILLFAVFTLAYIAVLLLTKSFDKEDLMLIRAIERRLGLNLEFLERIFGKFI